MHDDLSLAVCAPSLSTDTSILHTPNNILRSLDSGKSTIVIFLDLSAAFDAMGHILFWNFRCHSFLALVIRYQLYILGSYWTSVLLSCHMDHWRSTKFRLGTTSS